MFKHWVSTSSNVVRNSQLTPLTCWAWSRILVKEVCVAEHVSSSVRPISMRYSATLSYTPFSIACNHFKFSNYSHEFLSVGKTICKSNIFLCHDLIYPSLQKNVNYLKVGQRGCFLIFIHFGSLLHVLQWQYMQNAVGTVTKSTGRHRELDVQVIVHRDKFL